MADLQVFKPSPGLEPGTASLHADPVATGRNPRQTDFALLSRFRHSPILPTVATGCDRAALRSVEPSRFYALESRDVCRTTDHRNEKAHSRAARQAIDGLRRASGSLA
jgi:hypothetical protein